MPHHSTNRRFVLGLISMAPLARLLVPAAARAEDEADDFLRVSRILAGTDALSPDVAARIRALLADRVDGFAAKLDDLSGALGQGGGDREAALGALTDTQVDFALQVARPWYLGYVGTPSEFVLKDDAAFTTFLEAQSWEKIVDVVPRITYPGQAAGWWDAAPPGVAAPAMPERIADWTFRPDGPPEILPPDPAWRSYATADHADIEAARRAKPGSEDATGKG